MALLKAPPKQPKTTVVQPRLDDEARSTLTKYAEYLGLQRKGVKLSTKGNYESVLQRHILPVFGDMRMEDIVPLHVERFVQTKLASGLSGKTVRNLLLVLQAILSLAVDNDLIARSPIRKSINLQSIGARNPSGLPLSC